MSRFIIEKSTQQQDWWVLTDIENNIVIRFQERHFNETEKVSMLDDSVSDNHTADELAKIMREMGDWIVRYHSDICFDTPFGFQYSEDGKHFYFYRSKQPKWRLELMDKFSKEELAATMRKAAEYLTKRN